jgi:2-iminobutanoate/2-iminopropanoate deaminase
MELHAVNPPGPSIPGLSQAMIVEGGRLMLLSGHVPIQADGTMAGPGLEAQLVQTFENLAATLAAAGAGFANVARLTIYVRDFSSDQLPTIRAVRDRFLDLDRPAPASALIGVAALFLPDVLVEVDAIAALPER